MQLFCVCLAAIIAPAHAQCPFTGCLNNCATAYEDSRINVVPPVCPIPNPPPGGDEQTAPYSTTEWFEAVRKNYNNGNVDAVQSNTKAAGGVCIVQPQGWDGHGLPYYPSPEMCNPEFSASPEFFSPVCVNAGEGQIQLTYTVRTGVTVRNGLDYDCGLAAPVPALSFSFAPISCASCSQGDICCYEAGGMPFDYCMWCGNGCTPSMVPYYGCCAPIRSL